MQTVTVALPKHDPFLQLACDRINRPDNPDGAKAEIRESQTKGLFVVKIVNGVYKEGKEPHSVNHFVIDPQKESVST